MTENNYYKERQALYGITEEMNSVNILKYNPDGKGENILVPHKIFVPLEKGIEIVPYTLERTHITYSKPGSRMKNNTWSITRLAEPYTDKKGNPVKYLIPRGTGTYPFIPPALLEKYEKKEKIETLILTEGYYKAFKGSMHGLDIVGLTSITHFRDRDTLTIHEDIIKLIKTLTPKRVVWLVDGDCLDLPKQEEGKEKDLYRRPNLFFMSAYSIKRLLEDYEVEKVFAHIRTEAHPDKPKGLDDLLNAMKGEEGKVIDDFNTWSGPNKYFHKEDFTYATNKLRNYFKLSNVNDFITWHIENGHSYLRTKEFIFNGTKYKWDDEKGQAIVVLPGDVKNFFRVGDQYHEKFPLPNKYGQLENTFHRRQKSTIIDDYSKDFIKHIQKYKAFTVVPNHVNYQEIIYSCYNLYFPFEHEPEEGDCEATLGFLRHIFGNGAIHWRHPKFKTQQELSELELGLDYIQLLYKYPTQILPILCLVSRENGTGKSTFFKWLKLIFTQNAAVVGNAELADNFNASWASRLLIMCDETKIDKQIVMNKVKALSTADKILMNAKGKDHVELDFFGKFLFNSNDEENFIFASEEDVRLWVRKISKLEAPNVNLLEDMKEEIPAFLHFMDKRKLATEQLHRAWFHPELLKTEALRKVIAFSQPTVEKEVRQHLREMFFDFPDPKENPGEEIILMTALDVKEVFLKGKNYELNYIRKVLDDRIKVKHRHTFEYQSKEYASFDIIKNFFPDIPELELMAGTRRIEKTVRYNYHRWEMNFSTHTRDRVEVKGNGRPYVFHVEDFLTEEERLSRRDGSMDELNGHKLIEKGQTFQTEMPLVPNSGEDLGF